MAQPCLLALLLAAPLTGCSPSQPALVPVTPHGGTIVGLPGGKGFIEVLRQDAPGSTTQSVVVAYYFDSERKPMSPLPTAATLKLKEARRGSVPLKPAGDADPTLAGALTTSPFDAPGGIEGAITTTFDGKPVAAPISLR